MICEKWNFLELYFWKIKIDFRKLFGFFDLTALSEQTELVFTYTVKLKLTCSCFNFNQSHLLLSNATGPSSKHD